MKTIIFESSAYRGQIPCRLFINYSSDRHDYLSNWHHEFEIIYIVSGTETIYIENECIVAEAGDIVVINKNRIHSLTGKGWVHHCLIPSDTMIQSLGIDCADISLKPHIKDPELANAFLEIIDAYNSGRKYETAFKMLAIQRFLLLLFEKHEIKYSDNVENKRSSDFHIATKVINYLRQHLAEDFSIDEIASELGITTSYMCRCVKSATGLSILDHLNIIRCYTAKHLLYHTDKKISEIAELCGYRNASYFAKNYKKIIGISPSETSRR